MKHKETSLPLGLGWGLHHHRQHKQGCKEGNGCSDNTNHHNSVASQAVAPNNRIGDERMAGINAGHQEAGAHAQAQHPDTRNQAKHEGNGKGEDAETEALVAVVLNAAHLQLQASKEHDVVNAHLPENLKAPVVRQQIESIRPNEYAGHNKADDGRNPESPEQQRSKQNDAQHHKEYPCGVGNKGRGWSCLQGTEQHHLSHCLVKICAKIRLFIVLSNSSCIHYYIFILHLSNHCIGNDTTHFATRHVVFIAWS